MRPTIASLHFSMFEVGRSAEACVMMMSLVSAKTRNSRWLIFASLLKVNPRAAAA
jgi:hypothetical protein